MLYVEIQRGKEAMNSAKYGKYTNEIGATAAMVKRCIKFIQYCGIRSEERRDAKAIHRKEIFFGDSWFESIRAARAAAAEGHEFFGPIKTNTSGFPAAEIAEMMQDWPAGSSIVFECEDAKLFVVGYKYSKRCKRKC